MKQYRKFLASLLGTLAVAAVEIPPDSPDWLKRWGILIILLASSLGVRQIRNDKTEPQRKDQEWHSGQR